jgi:hypothetical protein
MQTIVETEEKPLGVIESLQQGFNFLNRHLWLLILPVLLDLFLWLGPRLSIASLVDAFVNMIPVPPDLPAELAANYDLTLETIKHLGESYNLFSLLVGLLTGLPSLFARLDFQSVGEARNRIIELGSWESAFLWIIILIPVGILIGSFWLTNIIFDLRRERILTRSFLGRWGWVWLNTNLYLIILFLALLFFSLLFGMIGATLMAAFGATGVAFFTVLWLLFITFILWLSVGLYFVVFAVAMDGVNLAQAAWRSLNVVGRNALSTLGLLFLIFLLTQGFGRIWMQLSGHTWGIILGILGNAYLGAAVVIAAILFYQSRYHFWQKTRSLVILNQRSDQNDPS